MTKAIRIHANGDPDVMRWEDIELPPPGPGEVRLRHKAIALNYSDVNVRRGGFYLTHAARFPVILGNEAAGVVAALGRAPRGHAQRTGRVQERRDRGQVLQDAGRVMDGEEDLPVDVVQGLGPLGVAGPGCGGAVGEGERAALGEPGDGVDEGVPVGLARGVEAESVDAYGVGGDRFGQFAQRHLRAVPPQGREGEDEVGVAAAVEGASRAGEGRAGGVQAVLGALEPGGVGGGDEPVAEHLHQVGAQLVGPAPHGRQRRLVRVPGCDQRMPQDEPYRLLVVGEFERGDVLGDAAHGALLPSAGHAPGARLCVVRSLMR
jgi:hypothetical protein